MPPKLDDEKIDKILELYDEGESAGNIAQKVNVAKGTVQKYVDRHRGEDDDDAQTASNGSGSGGGSVVETVGNDGNLVDLTDEELMDMSEGEFIRTFFTEFSDMGVKDSFVEMVANQAQIRQQIPDEDQLSQRLQAHNSGVGNANDANAIAELYWALAQRYLRSRGFSPAGGQNGGMMGMGGGMGGSGDWVSAPTGQQNGNGQQAGQSTDEGDWVSTGPSPGRQPNGGQPGQQPGQPQQGQQQNQQMAQFAQMMRQMQQQQQAMMEQVMQQQQQGEKEALEEKIERLEDELSDDGSDSPADSLQEFVELKETLDKINDDGSDERMEQVVGTLQQQLQGIQQQIAEDDSGAEMGQLMANSDGQMGALLALANSGDVDAEEMVQLATQLGEVESDPEVAAKKYEKEIEEMRVQAEQEKWQSIMEGVEQLTGTVGETLAGAVGGASSDDGTETESEPEVQTAEPEVEAAETTEPASQSPAQELVQQASAGDDPEPEQEGVTPDTADDDVIDAEGGVVEEDPEPEEAVEPEVEAQPEPEPEPAKADGGEEEVVCPGCGRSDFDNERQLRGHKAHCDEWD